MLLLDQINTGQSPSKTIVFLVEQKIFNKVRKLLAKEVCNVSYYRNKKLI